MHALPSKLERKCELFISLFVLCKVLEAILLLLLLLLIIITINILLLLLNIIIIIIIIIQLCEVFRILWLTGR